MAESKSSRKLESWYQQEWKEDLTVTRVMLQKFWQDKVEKKPVDEKEITLFRDYLKLYFGTENPKTKDDINTKLDAIFQQVIKREVSFEMFCTTIQEYPLRHIYMMNHILKWGAPKKQGHEIKDSENPHQIDHNDIECLRQYMKDIEASAAVSLRDTAEGRLVTPSFPENKSSHAFAMHSVGKVFTGMLLFLLVKDGTLKKDDLNKPIQLDESIIEQLPVSAKEHLSKVTLHQVMTHHAGLGDYLDEYFSAIAKAIEKKSECPKMDSIESFLAYAFPKDKEFKAGKIGEYDYSNTSILLVGLAIKHAYEKKFGKCDYDEILKKRIIDESRMTCFSIVKPENAMWNPTDQLAPHVAGSPAGGYWTDAESLGKFGEWIYEKSRDPQFKELLIKYGQEFYDVAKDLVTHTGRIPTSSACLTVSLKTGAVSAVLSAHPEEAINIDTQIMKNIFAAPAVSAATSLSRGLDPPADSTRTRPSR